MSRTAKGQRKAIRRQAADGTYVRAGRRPATAPRTTLAERRGLWRDERLEQRGLLEQDRAASYAAARPSTFRRQRLDLGGEADAHLRSETEFWRLREISRSMDRDDAIPGPVVESWLDLVLGGGIQMDPQTGFPKLNRAIKEDMAAAGEDPRQFDVAGRLSATMAERLAMRHQAFDGDVLVLLHYEGAQAGKIQLVEGQRLAGCDGPNGNILHGVELDPETGAIVAFHVLRRAPAERKHGGYRAPRLNPRNYKRIPAYDAKGRPLALLILNPKRATGTRGVTTWHRVFDQLGMTEDTFFATVAGIQGAACVPMAITTDEDVKLGRRDDADPEEGQDDDAPAPPEEELTPGTIPRLRKGESLVGSPNAGPSPDSQKFLGRVFRLVAMQVDLPYSLAFRDTSETVFHGWRGECEQAKRATKWPHEWFGTQYARPVYLFRLEWTLERLRKKPELAALIDQAEAQGTLRRVRATPPVMPYVDPKVDREADAFGIEHSLDSPRAVLAERGRDIDDVRQERHEDIATERREAKAAAAAAGEPEEWRAYCATWALGLPPPNTPSPVPAQATPPPKGGARVPA